MSSAQRTREAGVAVTEPVESSPPEDGEEFEPDYRFTLANERTFLAWLRTSLALMAGAVAVLQLVPEFSVPWARHVLGGLLAVLSLLAAGIGLWRWTRVEHAIRRGLPLPQQRGPQTMTAGLIAIGLFGLVLVFATVAGQ
jgi:putative membrane protein